MAWSASSAAVRAVSAARRRTSDCRARHSQMDAVQLSVVGVGVEAIRSAELHAADSLLVACGDSTVDRFDARLLLDTGELKAASSGGSRGLYDD